MKRDRILIKKELVPYYFHILLGGELFDLAVSYNETHNFFTLAVKKGGETICAGEPLMYGMPLFGDVYTAGKHPAVTIVPFDESGNSDRVTFEALGETVFLTVDNAGGERIG